MLVERPIFGSVRFVDAKARIAAESQFRIVLTRRRRLNSPRGIKIIYVALTFLHNLFSSFGESADARQPEPQPKNMQNLPRFFELASRECPFHLDKRGIDLILGTFESMPNSPPRWLIVDCHEVRA